MRKTARYGATRCALMAIILLVAGIDIVVQGQAGGGSAILAFAAFFAVLAAVQWRRGVL